MLCVALAALARLVQMASPGQFAWTGWAALPAIITYCQWVYYAYKDAALLGRPVMSFSAKAAVWAFFIPFVNFVRPYRVLRALREASDPGDLPDPPQYRVIEEGDYRASARELIPPPAWRKWCPVGLWWGTYMGAPLATIPVMVIASLGHLAWLKEAILAVQDVSGFVAAGLAIQVVSAIVASQRERIRRIELAHASTESGARVADPFVAARVAPVEEVEVEEDAAPAIPGRKGSA
jgi:hypothetical protein